MKVAWISYFPVEWLPEAPEPLPRLPRLHPATWQRTLLEELVQSPKPKVQSQEELSTGAALHTPHSALHTPLDLHIISVRRQFPRNLAFSLRGATFHCLKLPRGMRSLSLFWWETLLIRRCLRSIRPDLVQAWGTERGAALVASRLGYPYLVTVQGLLEWYSQQTEFDRFNRLDTLLERPSLRRARVASGESAFVLEWLRSHYPHLEVHHADVVPDALFHRVERRPEREPARLLFLATFDLRKGVDLLVRSLNQLDKPFRVVIAGARNAKLEEQLRHEAPGKFWERVEFKQGLGPQQVAQELAAATLVLCPTRADTGPMAVKEAAAAGVPVVGSAVGGIPDYITPGKNGLLFPSGDVEAFLTALRQALAHPLFGQGKVDEPTRDQVRERLSPALMAERFLAAYRCALGNKE